MALAAIGSPDIAERITEASALELKLAGINWAYSPVADVNSNPRNPIIGSFLSICYLSRPLTSSVAGVRSFGDGIPTHFQRRNVVLIVYIC